MTIFTFPEIAATKIVHLILNILLEQWCLWPSNISWIYFSLSSYICLSTLLLLCKYLVTRQSLGGHGVLLDMALPHAAILDAAPALADVADAILGGVGRGRENRLPGGHVELVNLLKVDLFALKDEASYFAQ